MKRTSPRIPVSEYLNQFIKVSATGRRLSASFKKLSAGTLDSYRYVQNLLLEYEQRTGAPLSIQLLHRASHRTLQKEKNYWSRFYTRFSTFLYREKGYGDHYAGSVFKVLKTFFNYLASEKGFSIGNYHRSFRVPLRQATPVVLQPGMLQRLITDKEFENSLKPSLKRAKDIFVFGCTVALRVSDLMRLQKRNLHTVGGEVYLNIFTQKTGAEVTIPLPAYALEIIERYRKKAGKYLLPRLAVTNLNIQLKQLVKKAGWDHPLTKLVSKHGRLTELKNRDGKPWKFYQHITSHTMRRTAITSLLILGVPEMVVRKLSGHAPGSKEFYRYVSLAQDYMNKEVKNAFVKLLETQ